MGLRLKLSERGVMDGVMMEFFFFVWVWGGGVLGMDWVLCCGGSHSELTAGRKRGQYARVSR